MFQKNLGTSVVVLALTCAASAVHGQDLNALYLVAKERDAQFQAARFAWDAAQQRAPQVRAGLLPKLSYTQGRSRQKGTLFFGEEEPADKSIDSRERALQLTQGIIRPEQWVALSQANAQEAQALAVFRSAQQDLALRLVQAYLDAWVASENVRLGELQLKAVQAQLALAKRNFEVGTTTITDVYEAQAKLDLGLAQTIAARSEFAIKVAELERLLGQAPDRLHGLSMEASLPGLRLGATRQWIAKAEVQSLNVLAAQAALAASNAEDSKHKAGLFPTLDLNVSKGTNQTSGSFTSPTDVPNRTRSTQSRLTLNWTLFEGGQSYYRIRESAAQIAKAEAELDFANRQAATRVRQSIAALRNTHAQLSALASGLVSSKKALDASKIGYKIGTRINIDVINAETQVFAVERDLTKTRAEALMHWVRLQAAVGELHDEAIAQINERLQTEPTPINNEHPDDVSDAIPGRETTPTRKQ